MDLRGFVPKEYVMNSKTEDILVYGSHLENGMIVLIENNECRTELSEIQFDGTKLALARLTNRWCIVTQLKIDPRYVEFTGVYQNQNGDEETIRRQHLNHDSWIVKKVSLPGQPEWIKNLAKYHWPS